MPQRQVHTSLKLWVLALIILPPIAELLIGIRSLHIRGYVIHKL